MLRPGGLQVDPVQRGPEAVVVPLLGGKDLSLAADGPAKLLRDDEAHVGMQGSLQPLGGSNKTCTWLWLLR